MEYDYKKLFEAAKELLDCPQCPNVEECHKFMSNSDTRGVLCEQSNFWEDTLSKKIK